MFRPGSPLRRRPSPAMIVALTALFAAFGGVGYAATALAPNSVGRAQIQPNAVNYQKIAPGSVGIVRINPNTVQARVLQTCNTGHSAITAIDAHGRPTCKGVLPTDFGTTTAAPVTVGATATPVAGESLSGDTSYLVLATPSLTVGGAGPVQVTCTLATSPRDQSVTGTASVANPGTATTVAVPLRLLVESNSTSDVAQVSCLATGAGTAIATTTIDALQTFTGTSEPNTVTPAG